MNQHWVFWQCWTERKQYQGLHAFQVISLWKKTFCVCFDWENPHLPWIRFCSLIISLSLSIERHCTRYTGRPRNHYTPTEETANAYPIVYHHLIQLAVNIQLSQLNKFREDFKCSWLRWFSVRWSACAWSGEQPAWTPDCAHLMDWTSPESTVLTQLTQVIFHSLD